MGVFVSKMGESIEASIQASLNTAQDHDGGPYPVYPSGKSRDETSRKMGSQGRSSTTTPFRKQISQLVDSDTVDPGWDGELMDNAFASAENIMCTNTGYSGTAYNHASRNCGQACLDDDVYISCDSVVGSQAQPNSYRSYSDATLPEKRHPSVERRLYRVAQN